MTSPNYPPGSRKAGELEQAAEQKGAVIVAQAGNAVDVLASAGVLAVKTGTVIKAVVAAVVSIIVAVIGLYELRTPPKPVCPAPQVIEVVPTTVSTTPAPTSPALTILPAGNQ